MPKNFIAVSRYKTGTLVAMNAAISTEPFMWSVTPKAMAVALALGAIHSASSANSAPILLVVLEIARPNTGVDEENKEFLRDDK